MHWIDFTPLSVLWRDRDRWDYVESCDYHHPDPEGTTTFADVRRAALLAAGGGADPGWMRALTRIERVVTAPFTRKRSRTDAGSAPGPAPDDPGIGDRVGSFFRVCEVLDDELVLGDETGYMVFRLSVLLDPERSATGRRRVVATVVVEHRSWLGRGYFAVVKPFHRHLVMPMFMGQLARNLRQG